jgi:metal-responsive CopG/Arc/MetJ family transcriptional regulator
MADTEKNKVWVHVLVEKDLAKDLDGMVAEDDSDRSKFIRNLIRQEKARRQSPSPTAQPRRRKTDLRAARMVTA